MRRKPIATPLVGLLIAVLTLCGPVGLHAQGQRQVEAALADIKSSFADLQELELGLPLGEAYYLVKQMQQKCNEADAAYQQGQDEDAIGLIKIHALMKMAAVIIDYQDLYDLHNRLALEYSRNTAVSLQDVLSDDQLGRESLRDLHKVYEVKRGDYRLESGAYELRIDRSPDLIALEKLNVMVAGSAETASVRARRFAESLTLQFRDPIVTNYHTKYYLEDAAEVEIRIRPTDYFFVPPKEKAKETWLRQKAVEFRSQRLIGLESGIGVGKIYIPDGEYTVYVGNLRDAPKVRPASSLTLAKDHPDKTVLGYVWKLSDGNYVEAKEIIVTRTSSCKEFFPKFKLLGFQLGTNTKSKSLEGDVGGRMFHRFNRSVALQTQGQVSFRSHRDFFDLDQILPETGNFIDRDRRDLADFSSTEIQIDVGPVFRFGDFQVAAMESIRYVDRDGFDSGGTLGQFFFNVGYLFSRGQAGFYYTKANMDEPVVKTVHFDDVLFEETFLKVMDQVGVNFQVSVTDKSYVEGAFGIMSSAVRSDVPGGVVRYVMPRLWKRIGLAAEVGYNESFVGQENSMRVGFGLRFDDWSRPSPFREDEGPVPVFVPRIRYETLTKIVRRGNNPPIADAGPDQLNLNPFTRVVLDGTGSSDPEGDTLEFQWTLLGDCPATIVLEGAQTATPSFLIGNGEKCTVELGVRDSFGTASAPDAVVISSLWADQPVILHFRANPSEIRLGESSQLEWEVSNADSITISNVQGSTALNPENGNAPVSPIDTTTYILTACNVVNECVSAEATVLVRPDIPEIVRFTAVPPEIRLGDCSVLQWETRGASRVFVTNLTSGGAPINVNTSDQLVVCPQRTTTYSLTATNDRGEIVSSDVIIVVRPITPVITQFTATPAEIREGETTDLCWSMENVVQASITNLPGGTVDLTGDELVSGCMAGIRPQGTTTYTLTTSNDGGEIVTASVTVLVRPALPRIVEFTATPSEIKIGESSLLTWATENADTLTLTNSNGGILPTSGANGSLSVTPAVITTYTLTATNGAGESVSAAVTVVVKPPIPVITRFTASLVDPNDNVINPGDPVLLEWETNADQHPSLVVNITNIGNNLAASGSTQVSPQSTTLYTLTVSNGAGEVVTASVIVEVRKISLGPFAVRIGQRGAAHRSQPHLLQLLSPCISSGYQIPQTMLSG